jgi:outer membrane immunogenic protein
MIFAKSGIIILLIAIASPAAAQTADEMKARIAALEKENTKLRERLTSRGPTSVPRKGVDRVPELAMPTKSLAVGRSAAAAPSLPGSWTGFYVGGNLGISTGINATNSNFMDTVGRASFRSLETFDLSPQGGLAGLQAGFNWQAGRHVVLGMEGDFQWLNASGESCVLTCSDPIIHSGGLLYRQELTSFGTLRARAGWTNGPSLLYLTGGGAYGQVDTDVTHTNPQTGHLSNVGESKWGWTAGGGVETQIVGNLTAKLEYLYMDLGTTGGQQTVIDIPGPGGAFRTFGFSSQLHDHVFRTGLNYKFGDPVYVTALAADGPVPQPSANWTGFYAGANGGIGLGRNPSVYSDTFVPGNIVGSNNQLTTMPTGAIFGGQAGYLASIAPNWLLGVETDLQGSQQKNSTSCLVNCASNQASAAIFGSPSIDSNGISQREEWIATFRARGGWTSGTTFYYATGGAAVGRIATDVNILEATLPPVFMTQMAGAASITATNWGWTVGGGIETALSANWSLKGEYLYIDLGRVSGTVSPNGGADVITVSSAVRNHIFRLGVNYRTDWGNVAAWN